MQNGEVQANEEGTESIIAMDEALQSVKWDYKAQKCQNLGHYWDLSLSKSFTWLHSKTNRYQGRPANKQFLGKWSCQFADLSWLVCKSYFNMSHRELEQKYSL